MSDYYRKYFEPEYGKQPRMQLLRKWTWNIQRNGGLKRILKQLQH